MNQFKSRKQNRLNDYDYSENGYYYITICAYKRKESFGIIDNDNMILNPYGNIAKNSWVNLPNHHKNIQLDEFVIMPNHMHGIIIINNPVGNRPACSSNKNNDLSVMIGSYKSTVTKQINQLNNNSFKWQKSFHDHIIRINESLNNICEYIANNPAEWDNDENNIKNYSLEVQAGRNPTR